MLISNALQIFLAQLKFPLQIYSAIKNDAMDTTVISNRAIHTLP
jgi:hypothetical protein